MDNKNDLEISNYWDDFQIRVNDTIDTISKGQLPHLQRLTVHITESCNMNCGYCNMSFNSKEIDFHLLKKIIDDYSQMNGKTIHFTGGEPTIYSHFEEACSYAKSKGLTVTSNTNALKKINTKYIDKLKASFDTPFEEEFEQTVGVKSFKKVVKNMKLYSTELEHKMLSITAVLNKHTYKNMLKLARFVHENFKVYNLYYSNYKGSDPAFAFSDFEIEDMFKNYIPDTLQFFKTTGNTYSHKQLSLYKPIDFVNKKERFTINKTLPCFIQLSEMTIDIEGNCHNCSHLFRDGVRLNDNINVSNLSLKECFYKLKNNLNNNYVLLDNHCLSGCNTNLIGFNKTVFNGKKFNI